LGNFFVVIPSPERPQDSRALFSAGIERAASLLGVRPSRELSADWFHAASFPRHNGSGSVIVSDQATGSWLTSIGARFHADGFACGEESRLLHAYLSSDARATARNLEGNFVLVIGDGRSREVVVITDIAGNCHGFMRYTARGLVLSGSSLLLASLEDFHVDEEALQEFLATGIVYEDRSLFREVRKFGPGLVTRFFDGRRPPASERYWSPASVKPDSYEGRDAASLLWTNLTAAAEKIRRAFPNPICDLTGGYDSRATVAAFAAAREPMATIVSGLPDSADVRVSAGLAKMAGIPHIYFEPPPEISLEDVRGALRLTDGEYELVEYSRIACVHERAARQHPASVNGCFGEVARGSWWELLAGRVGAREPLDTMMLARKRYAAKPFDASLARPGERLDLATHLAGVVQRTNHDLQNAPNTLQMDSAYILMRMQRWQGRIASSTDRIRACVSPFEFRSVLEVMLATKPRDRQRSLLIRRMLAEFQPKWAEFPLEHGYPAVPATWKNFYRFAPVLGYYAGRARAKIAERLGATRAASPAGGVPPARLQLWADVRVQKFLDPRDMHLAAALDVAALAAFLDRSKATAFPYGDQWARVLTVELALRELESAGARLLS